MKKATNRKVHPDGSRPNLEFTNESYDMANLELNNVDSRIGGPVISEPKSKSIAENINIISMAKAAGDQWKSYTNSKRKLYRKNVDPNSMTKSDLILLADMGIAEIGSDCDEEFDSKNSIAPRPLHNRALIQYISKIARSKKESDVMDLQFIEDLLDGGADVQCKDKNGQTIMHEVARAWDVDVARFFVSKGADVRKMDNYGRTPLHVAAAANYAQMVDYLIETGAPIETKTFGEGQTPCHYAAKNDATESLKALYKNGCDIEAKDYKRRTPLMVSAELDRSDTAHYLLDMGASAGVQDTGGMSCIVLMITKMAPVAKEALSQFHAKDRANRKQYYYINQLEHKQPRNWKQKPSKTALQAVVQLRSLDLIMHPVFEELIRLKWVRFAWKWMYFTLFLDVLFAISWSILIVTNRHQRHVYNWPADIYRIGITLLAVIQMVYQLISEFVDMKKSKESFKSWVMWRREQLQKDLNFVHPKWPEERKYLQAEIEGLEKQRPSYFKDPWNVFDWVTYAILFLGSLVHIADVVNHSQTIANLQTNVMAFAVIFVWVRLLKDLRAFRFIGPFIVMVEVMIWDILRFAFLYMIFYIPFACAFWAVFGGYVDGYRTVSEVLFSLFRITLVDDYGYDNLHEYNPVMCDILIGGALTVFAVISLNLFIALLSDTFQRVYDKARANAMMQQASLIQSLEEGLKDKSRDEFLKFIHTECSPETTYYDDDMADAGDENLKKVTLEIKEVLDEVVDELKHPKLNQTQNTGSNELSDDIRGVRSNLNELRSLQMGDFKQLREDVDEIKDLLKKMTSQSGGGYPPQSFPGYYPMPMMMPQPQQMSPMAHQSQIMPVDGSEYPHRTPPMTRRKMLDSRQYEELYLQKSDEEMEEPRKQKQSRKQRSKQLRPPKTITALPEPEIVPGREPVVIARLSDGTELGPIKMRGDLVLSDESA